MHQGSTPSLYRKLLPALLMLALLVICGSGRALAQDCTEWTLVIEESVPPCAYPLIVETVWGPDRERSPNDLPLGHTAPGTYTYIVPKRMGNPLPFQWAQISGTAGGTEIGGQLKAGQSADINIGCCCCVQMEVVDAGGGCITVTVREAKCP